MADPASYRPAPGEIPTEPGVYRFRDGHRRVVYVGKARNLRSRLGSYFADPHTLHPRTRSMVTTATSVDWVIVANEVEALALEYSWIKEYDPRFNVKYRDDKSYPYLAVSVSEPFPRAAVVREAKRKGTRYFGPYAHAWAIRDTLDQLVRVFPIRTCRDGVFRRARQVGRPCLLGYIDKCSAPCVGRIDETAYAALVDDFCSFLAGQSERYVRGLERQMLDASARLEYEDAARLRDRLGALDACARAQYRRLRRQHRRRRDRSGGGRPADGRAGVPRARGTDPRGARLRRGEGRGPDHRRVRGARPPAGLR